jgi:CRP-like cAMP-binding protein
VNRFLDKLAPDDASQRIWPEYLESVALTKGGMLFRKGDPANALYFIESGELAVVLEIDPDHHTELRRFGAGQTLGEMSLYHSESRTATVEALNDAQLWRLTVNKLQELERNHPRLALALLRQVASMLSERVSFSNVEPKEPLSRLAHELQPTAPRPRRCFPLGKPPGFPPRARFHPPSPAGARRSSEDSSLRRKIDGAISGQRPQSIHEESL